MILKFGWIKTVNQEQFHVIYVNTQDRSHDYLRSKNDQIQFHIWFQVTNKM